MRGRDWHPDDTAILIRSRREGLCDPEITELINKRNGFQKYTIKAVSAKAFVLRKAGRI